MGSVHMSLRSDGLEPHYVQGRSTALASLLVIYKGIYFGSLLCLLVLALLKPSLFPNMSIWFPALLSTSCHSHRTFVCSSSPRCGSLGDGSHCPLCHREFRITFQAFWFTNVLLIIPYWFFPGFYSHNILPLPSPHSLTL